MRTRVAVLGLVLALVTGLYAQDRQQEKQKDEKKDETKEGWIELFNGKDTTGWKLREPVRTVTKYVDDQGKEIAGAKKGKVDQKAVIVDAKNKEIEGAKVGEDKKTIVDKEGKKIEGAKVKMTGGRDAIVDAKGKEIKDAKAVTEKTTNPSGWTVDKGVLVCSSPHGGNDLLTEQKFTDFDLHVEFLSTSNSGVYLQGRYEIQIIDDHGKAPHKHSCGSLYGQIAPSKNMNKKAPEWNTFDVKYRAPRPEAKDKAKAEKARVTLVWNGETVISDGEISGPTGAALDGKVYEPGPLLLQGDHGRVSFRNVRIRPAESKR
jgi:hypothetical protein